MLDVKESDLWSECEKCEGLGMIAERHGPAVMEKHCPECHGKRIKVTPSGQALLSFISVLRGRGLLQ
jgi:Zn finger protein HypA/HybF involved in hydrogenase expression